jgi:hypothetical protein|tara:strand:+ start:643 stop:873 length:231 start_codon:yes stop_codon:yes gene_type:complete
MVKYVIKKMSVKAYKPIKCSCCHHETRDLWKFGTVTHLTYAEALEEKAKYDIASEQTWPNKPEEVYSQFGRQKGLS